MGQLEPARHGLLSRFDIGTRHFEAICFNSPFVPPGHERIFAAGFAHFLHGSMEEAVHLLVPQLENAVRSLVRKMGEDPSVLKADLIQEDTNLSSLLIRHRTAMEAVFGPDLTLEIELLFDFRGGPALRHQVAHGKLASGACHSVSCRYACWLIFRLTCLPLLRFWDQFAPAIDG